MIYLPVFGSHPLTIPFKYFGQFWMTLWVLVRHRPTSVFIMSPPLIAAFAPLLYCFVFRKPFVLDCHTAAYMHPRWKRLQWLQHWLGRRAATNIVTNDHLAKLAQDNGGQTTIVRDVPIVYTQGEKFPFAEGFSVAAVCSFNADEPIEELFKAAGELPDVNFYVTGNTKHLDSRLAELKPANVTLTGFVSDEAYGDLVSNANLVMSLTTRDHTMLRGAWEAIYQETPVVISDWPCLREAFPRGARFTNNSTEDIAKVISDAREAIDELRAEAVVAREERITLWQETISKLIKAINRTS